MGKMKGAIVIEKEVCKGCELCVATCPSQVISMTSEDVNSKGYRYATVKNPENCTGCANCAIVCPDAVITVYRKKVETEI